MSPQESAVKIMSLALTVHTKVNMGWNEGRNHDMLSRTRRDRLNIG